MLNIVKQLSKIRNNEVALNTALQFVERFLGLACSFISSIFVIRYFSASDYGVFAYSSSYVTLFSALTSLGLQSIVVRELIKNDNNTGEVMGSSFVIMIAGSLLAMSFALAGVLFNHNNKLVIYVVFIYSLVNIVGSLSVLSYYFQAHLKIRFVTYVVLCQNIIDISCKLYMVHAKFSLLSFAILNLIEAILTNIVILILFLRHYNSARWSMSFAMMKQLLHQSIPLAIAGAMVSLYMRLDQVMLEHYKGLSSVAEYSVGVKLIEMFYIIPTIIMPNIFPSMIKSYESSEEIFNLHMRKIYKYSFWCSIGIALIISIFGGKIVTLFYGDKYLASELIFQVGIWCIVPVYFGVFSSIWLQVLGLQKYSVYFTAMGLLSCVILNRVLIPEYGAIGAIIATIISQLIASIFAYALFDKTRENFMLLIMSLFPKRFI